MTASIGRRPLLGGSLLTALGAAGVVQAQPSPSPSPSPPEGRPLVTLATGSVTGAYLPVGAALGRLVNQGPHRARLRLLVEATDGTIYNLNALRAGDFTLAMAQSDWLAKAFQGQGRFAAAGPFGDLRAVARLHDELLVVVARPGAGITTVQDLAGKRVNLGPAGSGLRELAEALLASRGWTPATLKDPQELAPDAQVEALCQGTLDAALFAVPHPHPIVAAALARCGGTLIPVSLEGTPLAESRPDLVQGDLPARTYPGQEEGVPSFGVAATLVTTVGVAEDTIYWLVKSMVEGVETLRGAHPVLAGLELDVMPGPGLVPPLHAGAMRAFQEAGLLGEGKEDGEGAP